MRPFSEVLIELQYEAGMTNVELSDISGVSLSALSKFRSGVRSSPGRDVMHEIALALDVPVEYLFD